MKKIFIALMIAFTAMSSFATEYDTVYSCGFEDSETAAISKWDLKNAEKYAASSSYQPTDLFYVGNASHYEGNNSLYVSGDSGKTDTLRFYKSQETQGGVAINSTADLSISMAPGNYVLDFDYYWLSPQTLYVCVFTDRFAEADSLNISLSKSRGAKEGQWNHSQCSFKIPEGREGKWICFEYAYLQGRMATDTLLVKSLSIDNVLLKKEKTSSGVSLAKSMNIVVVSSNGKVRIAGTQARATIYNIGGAKVYEGADREIALPGGVYVVRIGEMAKKVIVK